jgi:hypothetical protein
MKVIQHTRAGIIAYIQAAMYSVFGEKKDTPKVVIFDPWDIKKIRTPNSFVPKPSSLHHCIISVYFRPNYTPLPLNLQWCGIFTVTVKAVEDSHLGIAITSVPMSLSWIADKIANKDKRLATCIPSM